jgi:nifR3 family TIM-barrel protein
MMRIGTLDVPVPVVLAPMAGVTNAAFRQLCAEQGAGLYVCEMITSRGIVEGDRTSLQMLTFAENETIRSVQLYGIDPRYIGDAVSILCGEHGVAHVDLNFGCPVPKVTRKGGGAALPWKSVLLGQILTAAVKAAEPYGVPVTMKTRKGIDDDHLTYLDAGRIAEDAGCAAIGLHGRTAAQHYSGRADWNAIADLKASVRIPVLGNGDIWEAEDALRMVRETGCDGVIVGRGCLGRPWLFADLAAAFGPQARSECREVPPGRTLQERPSPKHAPRAGRCPQLGEVAEVMRRHAELLGEWLGEERGCIEFRKHVAWYLKGFRAGSAVRERLGTVSSYAALDDLLAQLDPTEPYPIDQLGVPRGRQGSPKRVALPDGWLRDRELLGALDPAAEDGTSGG